MEIIFRRLAAELNIEESQVTATVQLLDGGATVPFIARYRKEATQGLDDIQLRHLEQRLVYLRELEARRETVLTSIKDQDKLTPELELAIREAETKTRLEDLYLPYKPRRRTKGQIAIEAGLLPLAESLFNDPALTPETEAAAFVDPDKGVADTKAALEGARAILMDKFSEDADLLGKLRDYLWEEGLVSSRLVDGKKQEAAKFSDYFEHDEPIKTLPSHRALAIFRGNRSGLLRASLVIEGTEDRTATHPCELMVARYWKLSDEGRAGDNWLKEAVRWTWRVKLFPQLETGLLGRAREAAEEEAIKVFSRNLGDLLLAAPAGPRVTIGLDPGLRTGVKVAVIHSTGKLLDHTTIFPHAPHNKWNDALGALAKLVLRHNVELIAIGNGTASRETERFAHELIRQFPKLNLTPVLVSEAGASVYSASEQASRELPDLDVSFRGAVSIARRLQDPLAELVKIEPKAIGVGQYQHDVSQTRLADGLETVVEDCVNAVGVDVNTASSALLSRVSGLSASIARNLVEFRNENGAFSDREQLKKVPRLGEKTFEQCAGFMRVMNGSHPLDRSAVHPEAYPVVERIAAHFDRDIGSLMGDSAFLRGVKPAEFVDGHFGVPTITDILGELDKPGRDPRPEFRTAKFKEGVESIGDLKQGMELEGAISNVTNFGAFVDIGVHQDGLVHISELSDQFVKDPRAVVKAGDVVRVKVMEVDIERRRIALTMRLSAKPAAQSGQPGTKNGQPGTKTARHRPGKGRPAESPVAAHRRRNQKPIQATLADVFANARTLRK
ncbi:MAG: Tex family protein [Kistimonas sp.]|nr:Tex family protein [Kistimonas sp.]